MRLQVTMIKKPGGAHNPNTHITDIGGPAPLLGAPWWHSTADAIRNIEAQAGYYFTNVGGRVAQLIVENRNGRKYLKTTADTALVDNLLSLPNYARD